MNFGEWRVGSELPPLEIGPITRRALALFAGGSGDHQPIHIDIDAARARGRPDVIAPGMISMAYLARFLAQYVAQHRIRSFQCRFVAVVPVLAEPVCTGRVAAISGTTATVELAVRLADGTVVVRGKAVIDIGEDSRA